MSWSVNDVIPRSDGPENLKIMKKVRGELTFGLVGRQLGSLPLMQTDEIEFRPWRGEIEI